MASVRCRNDTGLLLLDFRYRGQRCREQTMLPDTPANRTRLEKLAERIERAINQGTFCYADFFPSSPNATVNGVDDAERTNSSTSTSAPDRRGLQRAPIPTFSEFAEIWYRESLPRWRKNYRDSMRETVDRIFIPFFGTKPLDQIGRGDLLSFRAEIAKRPGRGGQTLSAKRINKLMMQLKAILNEGCDRHGINSPSRGIKPLKQKRADIKPLSLAEVETLIAQVRDDYRPYIIVRCFTGLRTAEANGLQWQDIDYKQNTISVRRTCSRDGDEELKNEFSKRDIPMIPQVRAAVEEQRTQSIKGCPWVFHSTNGCPIDGVNFANRVWYPLLRYLGLAKRQPYHMRHTAATLMLAAGENPEWIARILGHSTTEMLFRVYSRFVPNLTRQDGRAFAGLINGHAATPKQAELSQVEIDAMSVEALRRELKAALQAQSRGPPRQASQL